MTPHVLRLSIRMLTPNPAAEAVFWDTLVEWCQVRYLFIGGLPGVAVIYAPCCR